MDWYDEGLVMRLIKYKLYSFAGRKSRVVQEEVLMIGKDFMYSGYDTLTYQFLVMNILSF